MSRNQKSCQTANRKCLLCGKNINGFCNSHSVPRMILQQIADQGWVLKTDVSINPSKETERGYGLKRAGTFHLICSECDKKCFLDYEKCFMGTRKNDPNQKRVP